MSECGSIPHLDTQVKATTRRDSTMNESELVSAILSLLPDAIFDEENGELVIHTGVTVANSDGMLVPL